MPESFEPQGFFNGEAYRFEDGAFLVCGAELSIANTDDHAHIAHREIGV